jgi:hypothetical protein
MPVAVNLLLPILVLLCILRPAIGERALDLSFKAQNTFVAASACWVPVSVEVTNHGQKTRDIEVWLRYSRYDTQVYFQSYLPLTVSPGSAKQVTLYGYPGEMASIVRGGTVWLTERGRPLGRSQDIGASPAPQGSPVVLVLDRVPGGLAYLRGLNIVPQAGQPNAGLVLLDCPQQVALSQLPDRWIGYQVLDLILLHEAPLADTLRPAQWKAIREWVELGGTFVLSAGRDGNWYQDPFVEELCGRNTIVPVSDSWDVPRELRAARSEDKRRLLACPSYGVRSPDFTPRFGAPSVAVRALGRGSVWFVGVDLGNGEFRASGSADVLLAKILSETRPSRHRRAYLASQTEGQPRLITRQDITRLANGLISARMPSLWLLSGLIGAYLFTIGPLNYFILYRYRIHPYLLYTVPAISLFFVGIVVAAGYLSHGVTTTTREFTIAEPLPGTGNMRVVKYAAITAASSRSIDIELDGNGTGIPFYPDSEMFYRSLTRVRLEPTFRIEEFHLRQWQTGFLRFEAVVPCGGDLGVSARETGPVLRNRTRLEYRDCALTFSTNEWADLGRLPPGGEIVLPSGPAGARLLPQGIPWPRNTVPGQFLETILCLRTAPATHAQPLFVGLSEIDLVPMKTSRNLSPEYRMTFVLARMGDKALVALREDDSW